MTGADVSKFVSELLHGFRARLLKARTGLLSLLLAASVGALGYAGWMLNDALYANRSIAALKNGEEVSIDPKRARDEVLIARLALLVAQERKEEAQALVDASQGSATPKARARLLYMLANARVRAAMALIEKGSLDRAIPEVRLAKEGYRAALRLVPGHWDSRHNFDVAMRLVRDLPAAEQEVEEAPPDAPKRLWTDLPGVPRGLP